MADRQWVRGSNPPALTPAMKADGLTWRRLQASKNGFLWETTLETGTPRGSSGAPSGAPSSRKGV